MTLKSGENRFKKLLLQLFLFLGVPLIVLAAVEIGLTITKTGECVSLFVADKAFDETSVYRTNYRAVNRFFPGNLARRPLPDLFQAQKPKGLKRVFVLGESAARGERLSDFSFSRILEEVYNQDRNEVFLEVINTGVPAINSWVLREFAKEIVKYEPDLIIIYAGHNEFIGPYGPGTVFGQTSSRLAALAGIFASSLRLVQFLSSDEIPKDFVKGWQGLEMFLENSIEPGSELINRCITNWKKNIADIKAIAESNNVPIIFCRVPSNYDFAPFMSKEPANPKIFDKKLETIKQLIDESDFFRAQDIANELHESEPEHALLNYLKAIISRRLKDHEAAADYLKEAKRHDCFRVRVTSDFNDVAASLFQDNQIADVKRLFIENSSFGIIGPDLIYDHVHLTFKGHYFAARSIYKTIEELNLFNSGKKSGQKFPEYEEVVKLMAFTDSDKCLHLEHVIDSMSLPPFTLQHLHEVDIQRLKCRYERLASQLSIKSDIQQIQGTKQSKRQLALKSSRTGMLYNSIGKSELAEMFFYKSNKANPFDINTINNLGAIRMAAEDYDAAYKRFRQAKKLDSGYARALFNIALLYSRKDNISKAEIYYKKAISANPGYASAWRNLANLLFNNQKYDEAKKAYQRAFLIDKDDMHSKLGVANCLLESSNVVEALEKYQKVTERFSNSAIAWHSLGNVLTGMGRDIEALYAFEKGLKFGHNRSAIRLAELLAADHELGSDEYRLEQMVRVAEITSFEDPWILQVLAGEYAKSGKLVQALQILTNAAFIADEQKQEALAAEIRGNIKQITAIIGR